MPDVILNYDFAESVEATAGCELYIRPAGEGLPNGQPWTFAQDFSGKNRTLVGTAPYPINVTNQINEHPVIRFDDSGPLKNTDEFPVRCGFMVVRVNEETFSGYRGLLTDLTSRVILVGNNNTDYFYEDLTEAFDWFEYRLQDRIYPTSNLKAPMLEFRLIFFKFWKTITVNGIQLGQDRADTSCRLKADVALLTLFSTDFCEEDIQKHSKEIADDFGLTLPDVFPLHPLPSSELSDGAMVNSYQPPEGALITEVLTDDRVKGTMQFGAFTQKELRAARSFHRDHYKQGLPAIIRDYRLIPPEDNVGHIRSELSWSGRRGAGYTVSFEFEGAVDLAVEQDIYVPPGEHLAVRYTGDTIVYGGDEIVY